MTISIDYDNTYTKDPDLWDTFILSAELRGHTVICITNRPFEMSFIERTPCVKILYAADSYKKDYAEQNGYKVDIWIDDIPGTITSEIVTLP